MTFTLRPFFQRIPSKRRLSTTVLAFFLGVTSTPAFSNGQAPLFPSEARVAEVYQIMSHNTYSPGHTNEFINALEHVNAIEIDIWHTHNYLPIGGHKQDWYVRHATVGNDNTCKAAEENSKTLRECLSNLRAWHDSKIEQGIGHNLITVFIDVKQQWSSITSERTPKDLDTLIKSIIGEENIYKPSFLGVHESLRQAAKENKWPKLHDLRNHFLFILTGQSYTKILFGEKNKELDEYIEGTDPGRVFFVCPNLASPSEIEGTVSGFQVEANENVICYNIKKTNFDLSSAKQVGELIRQNNFLSHIWGLLEDNPTDYAFAQSTLKGNYIGLDQYIPKWFVDEKESIPLFGVHKHIH